MTYAFVLNYDPPTMGEALWQLKEQLVTAGWVVEASGDGTNYGHAGALPKDRHAPGGPYAGGMDTLNAWMRLRGPIAMTPRREFIIKKTSATAGRYGIVYSGEDGFTGGAPSATQEPTATDEMSIYNLPLATTNQWLSSLADGGAYFFDILIGDAAENFSFFFAPRWKGTMGYDALLALDVLDGAHASDPDPAVVWCGDEAEQTWPSVSHQTFARDSSHSNAIGSCQGWFNKNGVGPGGAEAFVLYPPNRFGAERGFIGTIEPSFEVHTGIPNLNFQELPLVYWRGGDRFATQRGRKGISHLFRNVRDIGFLRPNTTLTRMAMGFISIAWDGSTIPRFA